METGPGNNPQSGLPDFFLISPPKCASRWTFASLRDHPEIYMPPIKCVDFFTIHYHKGEEWYRRRFSEKQPGSVAGDYTHNYLQSPLSAERIYNMTSDALFVCCLREPVERAFSFYWHLKSTGRIQYEFREVLERYELFQQLIEPGFYDLHLERYFELFPRQNFLILLMDDLARDDEAFIQRIYSFLNVDSEYRPRTLDSKLNESRFDKSNLRGRLYDGVRSAALWTAGKLDVDFITPLSETSLFQRSKRWILSKAEYDQGIDPAVRDELLDLYAPHIRSLSRLIDRDFSRWID